MIIRGNRSRKMTRIQRGMRCVCGVRKFQLIMITVIRIVTMFMMNVNRRYLAMSGMLTDVGGKIFDTRSRKTTSARRIEMHMVIFSPASAGR